MDLEKAKTLLQHWKENFVSLPKCLDSNRQISNARYVHVAV